jgi:hypothetical protein
MRVGHDLIPGAAVSGGDGGVGLVPERCIAGDALFDGEISAQHCHGVGCRSDTDPTVVAFGTAAFEVAVWIGLVGGLADTCCRGFESHSGDAGGFELIVVLQPCYPIYPGSVSNRCVVGDDCFQLVQDLIEAHGHRVCRWRRDFRSLPEG